jgi:SAM-dependent methyltransferase
VDYVYEYLHPEQTIRTFEWRGVCQIVCHLASLKQESKWLDFGCGTGGLVAYARDRGWNEVVGYEQGEARLHCVNVPLLDDAALEAEAGTFEVVTAIEVIEHTPDPVAVLTRIRSLLRPGGLLFITTGNAQPYAERLQRWRYVLPDVHVSYFQPQNLAQALSLAGFAPEFPGYSPGWNDIIRFKVLKALRQKTPHPLTAVIPWHFAARAIDRRLRLSAHPVGWAKT